MEIRQITAGERTDTMFPLQAYAFGSSPWGDAERETYARRMVYYRTVTSLIAEEDGQTLAGVAAFPMRQNVRGVVHDMAGVASVSTHPSARRRGFVRQLMVRLMGQMREQGCAVSALYPFRPSFYGRLGYVGVPRVRTATFAPEGLSHLLRADLPGEVERFRLSEGFDEFNALTLRLLRERHGFSVYDETRTAEFRESPPLWVAIARVDGEVVGAVTYRIDQYGGDLVADDLLTTGPLGRALLLQFLARHVDQVTQIVLTIGSDEIPELWDTDLAVRTEGRVQFPGKCGPMVRLLSIDALNGLHAGAERDVSVEVVDDELLAGRYRISADAGTLTVEETKDEPQATLTCPGISALAYGVLDPVEVMTRGFGQVETPAVEALSALFPKKMPYLFADF
ncbi:GNAT family N-acetyltransferase [Couchioplanes caeruleus]|uniref:GNAT family N-acetyltransferase n=2 Tax=Couchioplanes caeruleus TaxID=56438 RepID=A0A1K0FGQ7_9ACTN|nr:GNAT family N-acetyltransferase [Couchioplanes caeruleus]OJF11904.1 GNAT family N-acetyltransferase [Couchioplanes caeruleus subsp. caeruleus]ROP32842.1 putative acetyltransferase [Couchioplanes caeruleus]